MAKIREGQLGFTFHNGWHASKYDDWAHYRQQFVRMMDGVKGVDILAISPSPSSCCWLVEVKDYRRHRRTKAIDLAVEIVDKVRNTLAGVAAAQIRASDPKEREAARRALRADNLRVVLHLEQPDNPSKLFPRAIDPAKVQMDLRRRVKAIDPHPLVIEIATQGRIPWDVA